MTDGMASMLDAAGEELADALRDAMDPLWYRLGPDAALGLPIGDTLLSMTRRMARGQPMFSSDRGHISDHDATSARRVTFIRRPHRLRIFPVPLTAGSRRTTPEDLFSRHAATTSPSAWGELSMR
jgi:hypothetical protein